MIFLLNIMDQNADKFEESKSFFLIELSNING